MPSKPETICTPSDFSRDASGGPVLKLPDRWAGLPMGVFGIPALEERGAAHVSSPMLLMALEGRGKRWYRFANGTVELSTKPGMIELYGRDFERRGARWEGEAGRTVGVYLPPEAVGRLAPGAGILDLRTVHEIFDPKLQWIMHELMDEAMRGAPGGALYAQGLSSALIGRLIAHYGLPREQPRAAGALSSKTLRRVLDHIDARLGDDLSIEALAREAALSPHHFARSFKVSLGLTPHRYVLKRRVDRALNLLRTSKLPIADIALSLGFASQSHLTQVLREQRQVSPAQARNG
jgi:AraC-like DNA-binding protein